MYAEVPTRVKYSLTDLGRSPKPILDAITGAKGTRAARSQMTINLMS
ncbi:hypothetical protein DXD09_09780 [Ligilactobacillus ruminis]|uniref:HTH hxlR-type domain-containing protein n=1 Tax=Ligilactobacillus ruminis TaxID=1623 RepID=A0A8B2Z5T5_9LACO|nr:hypothetical protein DXD09_09780 [Ligilactobacillus ruminis]